jgi:hypothetical protein
MKQYYNTNSIIFFLLFIYIIIKLDFIYIDTLYCDSHDISDFVKNVNEGNNTNYPVEGGFLVKCKSYFYNKIVSLKRN